MNVCLWKTRADELRFSTPDELAPSLHLLKRCHTSQPGGRKRRPEVPLMMKLFHTRSSRIEPAALTSGLAACLTAGSHHRVRKHQRCRGAASGALTHSDRSPLKKKHYRRSRPQSGGQRAASPADALTKQPIRLISGLTT